MKELHIWMGRDYRRYSKNMFDDLQSTEEALYDNIERVDTVQTHVCSTTWLVKGYRIFVHMLNGEVVEMKLGYMGENLKEIRVAHNLEKMVLAGCFGMATIDYEIK